ncbi:class I SAM-dependent methyltransferase [Luteolibacter sp. Populi]|uniref:class I SAM-dependent methyltransferase n=1 Tax=Luteolibacter sp. Populi TaxID=3230487 RepID=UPI003464F7E2
MPDTESNTYSPAWFANFHAGIPAARTEQEAVLVEHCCPLPDFSRLLDVCCGMGRHARALGARGYSVTGIERDEQAIAFAREQGSGPLYLQTNIRDWIPQPASFNAVIILSQSFGYFDAPTNREILSRLAASLRSGGRLILDLWNLDFFQTRQGVHVFDLPTGTVRETKRIEGDRLFTRLDYPDGSHDAFEFQTFSPAQMEQFAFGANLKLLEACTDYSPGVVPSPDKPKLQYLLERF